MTAILRNHHRFYKVGKNSYRQISSTASCNTFWERHPKGGYNQNLPKVSFIQHVKDGWNDLKGEFELFGQEIKTKFENDFVPLCPGVVDKQWILRAPTDLSNWVTTCDADHGEGFSNCEFGISPQGYGLFNGYLDTRVPKDGIIKRAGYASIRSKRVMKSFKRDSFLDWSNYTHLVIRCRGDGRSYLLNIATSGYFDNLWNDVYHYVLYTRGGPYWQLSKIPFSKFFFSNKGRVQDKQGRINLEGVTNFGITAGDKITGPFSLEIDYIGLEYDPLRNEEFAYEMYRTYPNIAST